MHELQAIPGCLPVLHADGGMPLCSHAPQTILESGLCFAASEVRAVLEDEATRIAPQSPDFWVLAAALKRFVEGEGGGSLPLEARPH